MKAPQEMSSLEQRLTGRRIARVCEGLSRNIVKAREQLDPVVFDLPAVRGVITTLSKTTDVLDRFAQNTRANDPTKSSHEPGAADAKRGTKSGLLNVASVFEEAVATHTGQIPVVNVDSPDGDAQGIRAVAPPPGGAHTDRVAEFPPGMFRLADILQLLAAHEKSGVLRVEFEAEKIEILISEGDLTAAQSIDGPEELRLGHILVGQGLVTPDQLKIVLAANKKNDTKLGQLLREWINLSDEQISEALRDQLKLVFQRALAHPEARVTFIPATKLDEHRSSSTARLNVMSILLESLAESEGPPGS